MDKGLVVIARKSFGEYVGKVVASRDVRNHDFICRDSVADMVEFDVDVLCSAVELTLTTYHSSCWRTKL